MAFAGEEAPEPALTLEGHLSLIGGLAFTPDGRTLISAGSYVDAAIYFWDAQSGELKQCHRGEKGSVACLALSPDGKTLAVGGGDTSLRL
ncbi:MAG TPA: hypothetical protein P5118_14180, partial [Planctomycetota bacterium]|nr:hypothetical protein [Planctomycetota bacterium]